MQHDRFEAVESVLGFRTFAWPNHQTITTAADVGSMRNDVQRCTIAIRWKQTHRLVRGILLLTDFLRQANR